MSIKAIINTARQVSLKKGRTAFVLGTILLFSMNGGYSEVREARVSLESGAQLPNEGATWIYYEVEKDNEVFDGQLIVKELLETGIGSETKDSGVETIYKIHLEAGIQKGKVKFSPSANPNQINFRTTFELEDAAGKVLKAGSLGYIARSGQSGILLVSDSFNHWKAVSATRMVVNKPELDSDADLIRNYKTLVLSHEDALSLPQASQQMLLQAVSEGSRLIVISPAGHKKSNFIEQLTGVNFSETGMSNLKSDLTYLIGDNKVKDLWLETGKSQTGESLYVGTYGKGSLVQMGYDPFVGELLNANEKQAVSEMLWIGNNGEDKYVVNENGFYDVVRKLPNTYAPNFIILLGLFGICLVLGTGTGLYLSKIKRHNQGMVIGIGSGTVLCLVSVMTYSAIVGYSGVMLNTAQLGYNTSEGHKIQFSYIGVKGNKQQLKLASETPMDLIPLNVNWYMGKPFLMKHKFGEQESWEIPRINKWQVNAFKQVDSQQGIILTGKTEVTSERVKGNSKNPTQETWYNPILLVNGNGYLLDAIKPEAEFAWDIERMSGQNLRVLQGNAQEWGGKLYSEQSFAGNAKAMKTLSRDTVITMLESTLMQFPELRSGMKLIVFTSGGTSAINLTGEPTAAINRGVQVFDLGHLEVKSLVKQNSIMLSDLQFLNSGTIRRDGYSNSYDFGGKGKGSQFTALTPALKLRTGDRYLLEYDKDQIEAAKCFNQKLGVWEKVEPATFELNFENAGQYLDTSGRLTLSFVLRNTYLEFDDLNLRREGVE